MFEEKVTNKQFGDFASRMGEQNQDVWNNFLKQTKRMDSIDDRLDRYSKALSRTMDRITIVENTVNNNAFAGEKANVAIRDLFGAIEELHEAVDATATALGMEISVLPEVPAEVTIQPGLPERLALTKLSRSEKVARDPQKLPAAVTMTVEDLNQGLRLVKN